MQRNDGDGGAWWGQGEKNYAGLDALKQGIAQDVVDLLAWWENYSL